MGPNSEIAGSFKRKLTAIYNKHTKKYHASSGYPKAIQLLTEIQKISKNKQDDIYKLIELVIQSKNIIGEGDKWFRTYTYPEITIDIEALINDKEFSDENIERAIKAEEAKVRVTNSASNSAAAQASSAQENSSEKSKLAELEKAFKALEISTRSQVETFETRLTQTEAQKKDLQSKVESANKEAQEFKKQAKRTECENKAKELDEKALQQIQNQHLEAVLKKSLNSIESTLEKELKDVSNSDAVSTATSVKSVVSVSIASVKKTFVNTQKTGNCLPERFQRYLSSNFPSISNTQRNLLNSVFTLCNLLGVYDTNKSKLNPKQSNMNGSKDLKLLESAIAAFFTKKDTAGIYEFFKQETKNISDDSLKAKFKVIKWQLEQIKEENPLHSKATAIIRGFMHHIYTQSNSQIKNQSIDLDGRVLGDNIKIAYNCMADIFNSIAKDLKARKEASASSSATQCNAGELTVTKPTGP